MRYWTFSLLGVAICSAAVAVVAWCTHAATRISLCTPADDSLACRMDGGQLGMAIAGALLLAIPVGSRLFAHRTVPRGSPLGLLALGLALTAAGSAALWSAVGGTTESGSAAQVVGIVTGGILLSIGPFLLFPGLAVSLRGTATAAPAGVDAAAQTIATATAQAVDAAVNAHAGERGRSTVYTSSAHTADTSVAGLGTLASQLAQVAEAKGRTGGDQVAARLRQLDDLRASGLLTAEEHAAARRRILDSI